MTKFKKGKIVQGTVTGIESYGIFVSCDEMYSGLIHISEISHGFVKNVADYVKIGDIINVEILDFDPELYQLKLSIKNINYKRENHFPKRRVVETASGFRTLSNNLPMWIEEKLKKDQNKVNYIDK